MIVQSEAPKWPKAARWKGRRRRWVWNEDCGIWSKTGFGAFWA